MTCRFKHFVTALFPFIAALGSWSANAVDRGQPPEAARALRPSMDLPAGFAADSLGPGLQVNGHPVNVWKLTATGRATDAVASVHAHWQARSAEQVQLAADAGWHIISRRTRAGYETAQLRDQAGRVEGYLAHWHSSPSTSQPQVSVNPWLPRSVHVASEVVSPNPSTRVTTWVGASPESAAVLLGAISDIARARGLQHATGPKSVLGVEVARFTGRSREWVVTLEPNANGTAVVAHLTEPRR